LAIGRVSKWMCVDVCLNAVFEDFNQSYPDFMITK
jgi:hypothetical protein